MEAVTFMENLSAMSLFTLVHLMGLLLILCSSQMRFQHTLDHYRNFPQLLQRELQCLKTSPLNLIYSLNLPMGKISTMLGEVESLKG